MSDRWRVGRLVRMSSYRRVWRSWERLVEQEELLRRPEVAAIDALRERLFPGRAPLPDKAPWKYLDTRASLRANLKRARPLGLLRDCEPRGSKHVLDLGCGAGFFLFIARIHGYDCLGLDVGDVPLYDETLRILGVRRIDARIEAFTPLPSFPHRFDVITAFSMVFNRTADRSWTPREWEFFLEDVHRRLAPGGRLYLEPNPLDGAGRGRGESRILTSAVRRVFLERGARIDRHTVLFPPVLPVPSLPATSRPSPASVPVLAPGVTTASPPRRIAARGTRPPSMRAGRRAWRAALAAAAASVVLLTSAELAVRALAPQEMRLRWYSREGVMVLMPGYRGSSPEAGAQPASLVEINSDGLRDREYGREKSPETFRVLVLGDARTTGLQVPSEETYPKRLESLLSSIHPRGRAEVVNAGIPGYGTADELRYLQSFGERWKPDIVVLAFYGGNDVLNNLEEGDVRYVGDRVHVERPRLSEWRYRVKAARSWIAAHSHLYHFLHASDGATPAQKRTPAAQDPAADRGAWRLTGKLVKEIDEVTRRLGARLVLVAIPDPASASPAGGAGPLLREASASGIPSLDLAPPLLARGEPAIALWERDRYLTSRGHERAAQALAAYLASERLIPS